MTLLRHYTSMHRSSGIGFFAISLLIACAGPQQQAGTTGYEHAKFSESVHSWVGLSDEELGAMIGPPTQVLAGKNEVVHIYYFVDRGFVSPAESARVDPDDPTTFDCRFNVTYRDGFVASTTTHGRRCVATE